MGTKCNYKHPLMGEAERDTQGRRQRQIRVLRPHAKDTGAPRSWKRQGMDFPLEHLGGVQPCQVWASGLQNIEITGFCCIRPLGL